MNWPAYLAQSLPYLARRQALYLDYIVDVVAHTFVPSRYLEKENKQFHWGMVIVILLMLVLIVLIPGSLVASLVLAIKALVFPTAATQYTAWAAVCLVIGCSTFPGLCWTISHCEDSDEW